MEVIESFLYFITAAIIVTPLHEIAHWLAGKIFGFNGKLHYDCVQWRHAEKMTTIQRTAISIAPLLLMPVLVVIAEHFHLPKAAIVGIVYAAIPSGEDVGFALYNEFRDRQQVLVKIIKAGRLVRAGIAVTSLFLL